MTYIWWKFVCAWMIFHRSKNQDTKCIKYVFKRFIKSIRVKFVKICCLCWLWYSINNEHYTHIWNILWNISSILCMARMTENIVIFWYLSEWIRKKREELSWRSCGVKNCTISKPMPQIVKTQKSLIYADTATT